MDIVEQDRNTLIEKMKTIEDQRDDLLRKGRVVESERNDFLRNNKLMEMQKDDLENRCTILQKTNTTLNSRVRRLVLLEYSPCISEYNPVVVLDDDVQKAFSVGEIFAPSNIQDKSTVRKKMATGTLSYKNAYKNAKKNS